MLSEKEKHGMAELLARMPQPDLFSLAQTVTSRLIVPESPSEAVTAIIQHTDRPLDLLKRRRVRKDFLFKYLHDKRVEGVEASADKAVIISHVLQLWGSQSSATASAAAISLLGQGSNSFPAGGVAEEDSLPEAPAPSRNTSYSSLCSLELYSSSAPVVNHLGRMVNSRGGQDQHQQSSSNHPPSLSLILNRVQSSSSLQHLNQSEDALLGPPLTFSGGGGDGIKRSESNWSFMDDQDSSDVLQQQLQLQQQQLQQQQQQGDSGCNSASSLSPAPALGGSSSASSSASSSVVPDSLLTNGTGPSSSSSSVQEMADTFVKWFYDLLNSASSCESAGESQFKPEHFYPDASANLCLQSADASEPPQIVQVQNNGVEVCSALHDVVRRYGLACNPNLCRDGVRGAIDPHGLVVVTACGTLHNAATCCGTFHQQFGLIRDPFDCNNWKIKFTNARFISRPVSELPSLSSMQPLQMLRGGGEEGGGGGAEGQGSQGASSSSSSSSAMALS